MKNTEQKREHEQKMLAEMIRTYCRGNHRQAKGTLCSECKELLAYAATRTQRCPFMENKTFCSNCRVHCYQSNRREQIRQVMRYAGPRMLFSHPVMAIRHLIETRKEKARLGRDE